ncbi:hypothetical protein S245_008924, partial [Arachis hypogaea]
IYSALNCNSCGWGKSISRFNYLVVDVGLFNWWCFRLCADQRQSFLVKIASVREVVLGAPLRVILKHLASRTVAPDIDPLVALVHRPRELFFLVPKFISHKPQELPKEIRVILDIK